MVLTPEGGSMKYLAVALAATALSGWQVSASEPSAAPGGPINIDIARGGDSVTFPMTSPDATARAGDFTLSGWVWPEDASAGDAPLVAVADQGTVRFALNLVKGRPTVIAGATRIAADATMPVGRWTHFAVRNDADGMVLYVNGRSAGRTRRLEGLAAGGTMTIAPRRSGEQAFAGRMADLRLDRSAVPVASIASEAGRVPDADLVGFTTNSPTWPVQKKQQIGQETPQSADTLPKSGAPYSAPIAKPIPDLPALASGADGRWTVNGWRLVAAPDVRDAGAVLSKAGYDVSGWRVATVPGTVLTTLVDRGVYPDPAYGLNNMAIPEKLSRQAYWYRTQFRVPAGEAATNTFLTFKGINYAAEIWVNGRLVGDVKGAFVRGRFDISKVAPAGTVAAVAVKILPPPHPGIAQEESLKAGAGENGGMLVLDGPTFVAAEGWDWIPSIRDRNMGIWQPVLIEQVSAARIGDPQIVTTLPKPDNSVANVEIRVPVENLTDQPVETVVRAGFDDVAVSRSVRLAPRQRTVVSFMPAEFPQLAVRNPKLWWPNGYGKPNLHDLRVETSIAGRRSDEQTTRFGIRQVTYDMSLMDEAGELRRVGIDLSRARSLGQHVVDGTHEGIRKVKGGWAASLAPGAIASPAVTRIDGEKELAPHLVIRVNGVRIAARGGNIGMDDFMKRIERDRLEPFFRLHRDGNMNIIRNWVGQNTEDVFFDLADEYGLMVLNDFWESTQDYNQQVDDVPLFMDNAQDVVTRYRNHPSIVAWIGRNEGVPQPSLNVALQSLIEKEDGTRLYMGSSNNVNLAGSGPYDWREPETYFTEHAKGFAVELGTPSFPTLESWKRAIPKEDLWPISDAWAYHDWHQDRGGSVKTYMDAMRVRFGEPTSLEDFSGKAQLLQYDSYRAIFEGFNAGLWKTNSARMLWMTQPAWPSSAWNIFSSDYDTQASYYAVQKASEPVHVQMNLPDHRIVVVNNTRAPLRGLKVRVRMTDLEGRTVVDRSVRLDAAREGVSEAMTIAPETLKANPVTLVSLEATDAQGVSLSRNFYWEGRQPSDLQSMTRMPKAGLAASASAKVDGSETAATITLRNATQTPIIEAKATLFDAAGEQVLPAYFTDNYVSLLPGEERVIDVRYPTSRATGQVSVRLSGWNVAPSSVAVR